LVVVQDTVVALQALAAFASLTVGGDGSGGGAVQLSATYANDTHRFAPITRDNSLLLQKVQVTSSAISLQCFDAVGWASERASGL